MVDGGQRVGAESTWWMGGWGLRVHGGWEGGD